MVWVKKTENKQRRAFIITASGVNNRRGQYARFYRAARINEFVFERVALSAQHRRRGVIRPFFFGVRYARRNLLRYAEEFMRGWFLAGDTIRNAPLRQRRISDVNEVPRLFPASSCKKKEKKDKADSHSEIGVTVGRWIRPPRA